MQLVWLDVGDLIAKAIGPNGEHYGFYGFVPLTGPDGKPTKPTLSRTPSVVDLTHPDKVLYTLKGISQASGAFDPKTGRMMIVGNTADGTRSMWESAPVNQMATGGIAGNPTEPSKVALMATGKARSSPYPRERGS